MGDLWPSFCIVVFLIIFHIDYAFRATVKGRSACRGIGIATGTNGQVFSSRLRSSVDDSSDAQTASIPIMINNPPSSTSVVAKGGQTELPNDFGDAVDRAARRSMDFIKSGGMRCRVDFDTTVGDMTYTSIKNAAPVLKELSIRLSMLADLSVPPPPPESESVEEKQEDVVSETMTADAELDKDIPPPPPAPAPEFPVSRSLRIFYPDMGAAVLPRRDWKMGTVEAEVPPCVYTANIQNDQVAATDQIVIIACPQYSETDSVKRVLDMCDTAGIPCIMLNPELINMDQGYGVRARNLRKTLLSTFTTTYKLKTLKEGAVVREYPLPFTIWKEDATQPEGYTAAGSFGGDPTRDEIEEALMDPEERAQAEQSGNIVTGAVGEIVGFFQGLSRM